MADESPGGLWSRFFNCDSTFELSWKIILPKMSGKLWKQESKARYETLEMRVLLISQTFSKICDSRQNLRTIRRGYSEDIARTVTFLGQFSASLSQPPLAYTVTVYAAASGDVGRYS